MKEVTDKESFKFFHGPHNRGALGFILLYPAESIKKDNCHQITKEGAKTISPCDVITPYTPEVSFGAK